MHMHVQNEEFGINSKYSLNIAYTSTHGTSHWSAEEDMNFQISGFVSGYCSKVLYINHQSLVGVVWWVWTGARFKL